MNFIGGFSMSPFQPKFLVNHGSLRWYNQPESSDTSNHWHLLPPVPLDAHQTSHHGLRANHSPVERNSSDHRKDGIKLYEALQILGYMTIYHIPVPTVGISNRGRESERERETDLSENHKRKITIMTRICGYGSPLYSDLYVATCIPKLSYATQSVVMQQP